MYEILKVSARGSRDIQHPERGPPKEPPGETGGREWSLFGHSAPLGCCLAVWAGGLGLRGRWLVLGQCVLERQKPPYFCLPGLLPLPGPAVGLFWGPGPCWGFTRGIQGLEVPGEHN